jgi:hypothetical protein
VEVEVEHHHQGLEAGLVRQEEEVELVERLVDDLRRPLEVEVVELRMPLRRVLR